MPKFQYKAKDTKGNLKTGKVEAFTEERAADILVKNNLTPVSIKEEGVSFEKKYLKFLNKISLKDKVIFSRQLATMISAAMPIVQALKALSHQTKNEKFREIILDIASKVEGGTKLSVALDQYPEAFSKLYVSVVRSGETSGELDSSLMYLADQIEEEYDLISKIRGSMIYPLFIFAGIIIVSIVMMMFVIPQFLNVLKDTATEIPLPTQILIAITDFMTGYWWAILIVILIAAYGFKVYIGTPDGRKNWDGFKLKMPIFGILFKEIYLIRFSRNLHTLIEAGVSITDSLKIVADIVGNKVYEEIFIEVSRKVETGDPISATLKKYPEIPIMIPQMISVGESTGKIDYTLKKIADFYTREVSNKVKNLTGMIEPIVIVLLGTVILVLFLAVIMPIYSLVQSF